MSKYSKSGRRGMRQENAEYAPEKDDWELFQDLCLDVADELIEAFQIGPEPFREAVAEEIFLVLDGPAFEQGLDFDRTDSRPWGVIMSEQIEAAARRVRSLR